MSEYRMDATNKVLGRLASEIALRLRGKHYPSVDRVVVLHADRIRVTGQKLSQKQYRRHSGYPGGLTERTLAEVLRRDSRFAIRNAVAGMLPKNRTRRKLLQRLVFDSGEIRN